MTLDHLRMVMILAFLYVSNTRYEKNLESAQPIKIEFRFSENIQAVIYAYALVKINEYKQSWTKTL